MNYSLMYNLHFCLKRSSSIEHFYVDFTHFIKVVQFQFSYYLRLLYILIGEHTVCQDEIGIFKFSGISS